MVIIYEILKMKKFWKVCWKRKYIAHRSKK
jgi:hypothetical protein